MRLGVRRVKTHRTVREARAWYLSALLPGTKAGKAEWERVLHEVTVMGLEAPAASSMAARHGELRGQLSVSYVGVARAQQRWQG